MIDYIYLIRLTQKRIPKFCEECSKYEGVVDLGQIDRSDFVDAKSIMSVMTLDLSKTLWLQYRTVDSESYADFCKEMRQYSIQ